MYLPEPKTKDKDGSLVRLYVNLPPELQASDTAAFGAATTNGDDADTPAAVNSNEDSLPSSFTTNSALASHVPEPELDEVSSEENTRTNNIQINSREFPLELSKQSKMEINESSDDLAKTEIKRQNETTIVQATEEAKQLNGELEIIIGEPELLSEGPFVPPEESKMLNEEPELLNEEPEMVNEDPEMLNKEPGGLMLQNPGSDSDTGEEDRMLGEGGLDEEDCKMEQDNGIETDLAEDDEEGKLLFDNLSEGIVYL